MIIGNFVFKEKNAFVFVVVILFYLVVVILFCLVGVIFVFFFVGKVKVKNEKVSFLTKS